MARVPWRTAMAPRTVLILNGVEKRLDTPDIVTACRAMYEDYAAVRACNKVLFRVFMRMGKLIARPAAPFTPRPRGPTTRAPPRLHGRRPVRQGQARVQPQALQGVQPFHKVGEHKLFDKTFPTPAYMRAATAPMMPCMASAVADAADRLPTSRSTPRRRARPGAAARASGSPGPV